MRGLYFFCDTIIPPHRLTPPSPARGEGSKENHCIVIEMNKTMNQKRLKLPVNGWLNVWKPVGMSSMQAVAKARWLFNAAKAGHAGTLDPLADGILPIAFGEATKLIPLLHEAAKAYRFTVRWGVQTNTDDSEGDSIATSDHRPIREQITAALPQFTGDIQQIPPKFSAVKINGERAYAMARAGQDVVITARPVRIDQFTLIDTPDSETAVFEVRCGTGTYVRSLARDLALTLGTVGHCLTITRIYVGDFTEKTSISLESLEEMPYESRQATLWPLAKALDDILAIAITDTEAQRLQRGQDVRFLSKIDSARLPDPVPQGQILAVYGDQIIAICSLNGVTLHPERVLKT